MFNLKIGMKLEFTGGLDIYDEQGNLTRAQVGEP